MTNAPLFKSSLLNQAFQSRSSAFPGPFTAIDFQVAKKFTVPALPTQNDLNELEQLKSSMVGAAAITEIEILDFKENSKALEVICDSWLSKLPLQLLTLQGADQVDLTPLSKWKSSIKNILLNFSDHIISGNVTLPGETLVCKVKELNETLDFRNFSKVLRLELDIGKFADLSAGIHLPPSLHSVRVNQIAPSLILTDGPTRENQTVNVFEAESLFEAGLPKPGSVRFMKVTSLQTSGNIHLEEMNRAFPNLLTLSIQKARLCSGNAGSKNLIQKLSATSCDWHGVVKAGSLSLDQLTHLTLNRKFNTKDLIAILSQLPSLKELWLDSSWEKNEIQKALEALSSSKFWIHLESVTFNDFQQYDSYENGVWSTVRTGSPW